MDIIIYGTGSRCGKVIATVEKYSNVRLLGLADSYKNTNPWGFPMIDLKRNMKEYRDVPVVISVAHPLHIMQIYSNLQEMGYQSIYLYLNKSYCNNMDFFDGECILLEGITEYWLPRLEMHAADHCNLNCKGCSNFSPLFDRELPELGQSISDIVKLKELTGGVIEFNLLGGEPLLNPRITDFVTGIRENLPVISMHVVTNGLLIPQMDGKVLECFHNNNVIVVISEYEPTHRMIEKIKEKLELFQVDYVIDSYSKKRKFYKLLSLSENSIYPHECLADICVNVGNGKIARCPMLLYLSRLNRQFNLELPEEGVYRLEEFRDGLELKQKLMRRFPLCKHCITKEVAWSQCDREVRLEDFVEFE